jgi:hypothetical protein
MIQVLESSEHDSLIIKNDTGMISLSSKEARALAYTLSKLFDGLDRDAWSKSLTRRVMPDTIDEDRWESEGGH